MNIKGKFVTLRAIEKSDLQMLQQMLNDPGVESKVVGWSFPVSFSQQENWYSTYNPSKELRLIIETETDGAVGYATLVNIDWKNRSATHGIKIADKQHRSKGVGTDAVMAIMKYAFEELQLMRLDGSWIADNLPSQNLYLKCGWKVEGVKEFAVFKGNRYHDLCITGITRDMYFDLIERNKYWE